jgi:hypothetical protein
MGEITPMFQNASPVPPAPVETTTLTKADLHFVVSRIPKDIRELMMAQPIYLAGGFIRALIAREEPNDIDLFGATQELLENVANKLAVERSGRVYMTKNAITVLAPPRLAAQFITRWLFADAAKLMQSFDFTIAQAVVWFDPSTVDLDAIAHWKSVISPSFYSDLAARRLNYTSPERNEDAGGSLLRMRKFLSRGYQIQAGSLAAVIARLVSRVDPTCCDIRNEGYVKTILHGLLREVDPLTVIDGLEPLEEEAA